jgi:hypothetical protein
MSRYRVLKSVAHNWAHSLLSDWPLVGDSILIQHLLEAARTNGVPTLLIDPLNEIILPEKVITPALRKSLHGMAAYFQSILTSQGCSLDMVEQVQLELSFDLERKNPSYKDVQPGVYYGPGIRMPEAPVYSARVVLVDNKGREHHAVVREFWRG